MRGGSLGHARGLTGWPRRDTGKVVPYRVGDLVVRNNILAYNGSAIRAVNHPDDFKVLDGNLYWPRWGNSGKVCWVGRMSTLDELRSAGFELHGRLGPPLFVDRAEDDFRLRPESPAAGMCRPVIDVPKDKEGNPRDSEATSAGAFELPRNQRGKPSVSEAEAAQMLKVWERRPVRTEAGLELGGGGRFRLSWNGRPLVASDSILVNAVLSRPGWGRSIWHTGRRGAGTSFSAQITTDGRPSGTVATWDEPDIALARRQVTLDGNTATAWYRASVPPGCVYRPNWLRLDLALPGQVYAGAGYMLRDEEGESVKGDRLPEAALGRRRFSDLTFSLADATVSITCDKPLYLGWNNKAKQYYLQSLCPIVAARGADETWTVKVVVRPR